MVWSWLEPSAVEQGVVLTSLERAVEEHAELVERWYMRRLSHEEGKFAAATAAFWSGGAFLHVPRGVRLERPIQIVYMIDEPGTAQYAHTLGVVGESAECALREYYVAPEIDGQALHAGAFELYLEAGANVKLAHFQDWGRGEVYDVSTKRVEIGRDAHCSWVPVHPGGRLTKQTLDIVTAERGSDMRHTGLYFTERDEHLDLFTTDLHEQGDTTGDTVWKALAGESRASYEGLIQIDYGAQNTNITSRRTPCCCLRRRRATRSPADRQNRQRVRVTWRNGRGDRRGAGLLHDDPIQGQDVVRTLVEGYFEWRCSVSRTIRSSESSASGSRRSRRRPRSRSASRDCEALMSVAPTTLPDVRADFRCWSGGAGRAPHRLRGHLPEAAAVLEAMSTYYARSNAFIHRGVYALAQEATELFEGARERGGPARGWDPTATIFTLVTRPRRSTSWHTRGAATMSARATRCSSPRWSTTRTSCPGSSCARSGARTATLRVGRGHDLARRERRGAR